MIAVIAGAYLAALFGALLFLPTQYFMVLLLAGFPIVVAGAGERRR